MKIDHKWLHTQYRINVLWHLRQIFGCRHRKQSKVFLLLLRSFKSFQTWDPLWMDPFHLLNIYLFFFSNSYSKYSSFSDVKKKSFEKINFIAIECVCVFRKEHWTMNNESINIYIHQFQMDFFHFGPVLNYFRRHWFLHLFVPNKNSTIVIAIFHS